MDLLPILPPFGFADHLSCPACGAAVATQASACPRCAQPFDAHLRRRLLAERRRRRALGLGLAIGLLLLLTGLFALLGLA